LEFGLDGALYIPDFYYPIIGHAQHSNRDKNRDYTHGRIWRLTRKNSPLLEIPQIAESSSKELLQLLKNPLLKVRQLARLELEKRPKPEVLSHISSLQTALTGNDTLSLEILWLQERLRAFDAPTLFKKLIASNDLDNQRAATAPSAGGPRHSARVSFKQLSNKSLNTRMSESKSS